ncbi:MAG: 50S ribosomal protein L25/general stress protein Ctc [Cellulomonas sp. 73-145]|uniref:50S ribosomal protein L25/general stress protein Ctc n=1 Tax=unclassified Cellulomonas TaxID=2620175 RepID=UPI000928E97B|nr:50S ribosomal protein L25/general stress protein Ctc [Cellulomonas sp. 73-145]MBN9327415.1 50S ribosomal protein L25/general stress protein Ctc [Cellulomonas sp.]OJV56952.1 MAG: 50S ribosomal protein L25/general stress protein Ctc [Cellulomonas sp. 73-145]
MAETKLVATARTEFGKGAARRLRRAHQIPAVLYGHGTAPVHVALPGHELMLAVKHSNALLAIELDGKTTLALAKDVQVEPVHQVIEHVDLLIVRRGEKVTVDVPVHVVGESAPGTIHVVETQTLSLEADATALPDRVEVSIEGLEDGAIVHAGGITLPAGATLLTDAEHIVLTVSVPRASAEDLAIEEAASQLADKQSAASAAAAEA